MTGHWSSSPYLIIFWRDSVSGISFSREYAGIKPGDIYVKLVKNGVIWMSDTPMERRTNTQFINKATGSVLIAGLGIGMLLPPLFAKIETGEVADITVIELEPDVIELVGTQFDHPKLKIINADINEFDFGSGYDTIYLDIWPDINEDNLASMDALIEKSLPFVNTGGWFGVWRYMDVLSMQHVCSECQGGCECPYCDDYDDEDCNECEGTQWCPQCEGEGVDIDALESACKIPSAFL